MVTERISSGITPDRQAIDDFAARLTGEVILPGDESYDAACLIWNAAGARRPALIVRPAGEFDVVTAVKFARAHDLPLAVRSGGHSMAGQSTVDDGLVIDLSSMKAMSIDPDRRVARVQPGLTWAEYAAQAQVYGLSTSSGDAGGVGIGGLTLGGGIGWMVRKHGLTIDHLLAIELVTAGGRLLRASATENPDLFWAVRGGGGNFGIATAFEFRLHPTGMVLGGAVVYAGDEAESVLRGLTHYAAAAPDELTTITFIMPAPPLPFIPAEHYGKLVVAVMACYAGDLDEGERVMAPLRSLGTPIADVIGPMPYPALFAMTEEATVKGLHHEVRSTYLKEIDDELIRTIIEQLGRMPGPMGLAQIRVLGGAMARVPEDATAFAHRDKPFSLLIESTWIDPTDDGGQRGWVEDFWRIVRPRSAGVYVNFLGEEGDGRVRHAYKPATFDRLVAAKKKYDPENVFRRNQNIKPGV